MYYTTNRLDKPTYVVDEPNPLLKTLFLQRCRSRRQIYHPVLFLETTI